MTINSARSPKRSHAPIADRFPRRSSSACIRARRIVDKHPRRHSLDRDPRRRLAPRRQALPALDERGSSVEQFRSLRSRIQSFATSTACKSLLVSSGIPQEGKSFIAANLAHLPRSATRGAGPADRWRHAPLDAAGVLRLRGAPRPLRLPLRQVQAGADAWHLKGQRHPRASHHAVLNNLVSSQAAASATARRPRRQPH